jgi:pimeloyl-ACP methyl ester carboxylesterase
MARPIFLVAILAGIVGLAEAAGAQSGTGEVLQRRETIWSEGTRLAADVYSPAHTEGRLPTIVMAYGWGGTMVRFREEALSFARAGYLVVTFDYRGWGDSDARVVLTGPAPSQQSGHRFTAEVRELREIFDPLAEVEDLTNVVHWLQSEAQSDLGRIGLWGTSFGGAIAASVAGRDPRIKALHAQVAPLELRALDSAAYQQGTQRARGELSYPPPGVVAVLGLRGAPIAEHFLGFSPARSLSTASGCAVQLVLAGREELFDVRPVIAAYDGLATPSKNLVIIPDIGHYDIYGKARSEADRLALAWFDKHLKQ